MSDRERITQEIRGEIMERRAAKSRLLEELGNLDRALKAAQRAQPAMPKGNKVRRQGWGWWWKR
jgi:hypothetical protein